MMIIRLKLILPEEEYGALTQYALSEIRNPTDQAHYIIRKELKRLGWLPYVPLPKIDLSTVRFSQ